MLSIFQPARCETTVSVPYMPDQTARYQGPYLQTAFNVSVDTSPIFIEARLPVCPADAEICSHEEESTPPPIILLSPGWSTPRLYYSHLAASIASHGFTVITIDHPSIANIITYPDNSTAYVNTSTWNDGYPTAAASVCADDASFVIDQLHNATAMAELLPQLDGRPFETTNKIGMLGHSLGGAASTIAAGRDSRIRAAINWDGPLYADLLTPESDTPVLLMMSATTELFPDWHAGYALLNGPKTWAEVANTTHQTFTDIPSLLRSGGGGQDGTPPFAELLGTIAPEEMVGLLAMSTVELMGRAFRGEGEEMGLSEMEGVRIVEQRGLA